MHIAFNYTAEEIIKFTLRNCESATLVPLLSTLNKPAPPPTNPKQMSEKVAILFAVLSLAPANFTPALIP